MHALGWDITTEYNLRITSQEVNFFVFHNSILKNDEDTNFNTGDSFTINFLATKGDMLNVLSVTDKYFSRTYMLNKEGKISGNDYYNKYYYVNSNNLAMFLNGVYVEPDCYTISSDSIRFHVKGEFDEEGNYKGYVDWNVGDRAVFITCDKKYSQDFLVCNFKAVEVPSTETEYLIRSLNGVRFECLDKSFKISKTNNIIMVNGKIIPKNKLSFGSTIVIQENLSTEDKVTAFYFKDNYKYYEFVSNSGQTEFKGVDRYGNMLLYAPEGDSAKASLVEYIIRNNGDIEESYAPWSYVNGLRKGYFIIAETEVEGEIVSGIAVVESVNVNTSAIDLTVLKSFDLEEYDSSNWYLEPPASRSLADYYLDERTRETLYIPEILRSYQNFFLDHYQDALTRVKNVRNIDKIDSNYIESTLDMLGMRLDISDSSDSNKRRTIKELASFYKRCGTKRSMNFLGFINDKLVSYQDALWTNDYINFYEPEVLGAKYYRKKIEDLTDYRYISAQPVSFDDYGLLDKRLPFSFRIEGTELILEEDSFAYFPYYYGEYSSLHNWNKLNEEVSFDTSTLNEGDYYVIALDYYEETTAGKKRVVALDIVDSIPNYSKEVVEHSFVYYYYKPENDMIVSKTYQDASVSAPLAIIHVNLDGSFYIKNLLYTFTYIDNYIFITPNINFDYTYKDFNTFEVIKSNITRKSYQAFNSTNYYGDYYLVLRTNVNDFDNHSFDNVSYELLEKEKVNMNGHKPEINLVSIWNNKETNKWYVYDNTENFYNAITGQNEEGEVEYDEDGNFVRDSYGMIKVNYDREVFWHEAEAPIEVKSLPSAFTDYEINSMKDYAIYKIGTRYYTFKKQNCICSRYYINGDVIIIVDETHFRYKKSMSVLHTFDELGVGYTIKTLIDVQGNENTVLNPTRVYLVTDTSYRFKEEGHWIFNYDLEEKDGCCYKYSLYYDELMAKRDEYEPAEFQRQLRLLSESIAIHELETTDVLYYEYDFHTEDFSCYTRVKRIFNEETEQFIPYYNNEIYFDLKDSCYKQYIKDEKKWYSINATVSGLISCKECDDVRGNKENYTETFTYVSKEGGTEIPFGVLGATQVDNIRVLVNNEEWTVLNLIDGEEDTSSNSTNTSAIQAVGLYQYLDKSYYIKFGDGTEWEKPAENSKVEIIYDLYTAIRNTNLITFDKIYSNYKNHDIINSYVVDRDVFAVYYDYGSISDSSTNQWVWYRDFTPPEGYYPTNHVCLNYQANNITDTSDFTQKARYQFYELSSTPLVFDSLNNILMFDNAYYYIASVCRVFEHYYIYNQTKFSQLRFNIKDDLCSGTLYNLSLDDYIFKVTNLTMVYDTETSTYSYSGGKSSNIYNIKEILFVYEETDEEGFVNNIVYYKDIYDVLNKAPISDFDTILPAGYSKIDDNTTYFCRHENNIQVLTSKVGSTSEILYYKVPSNKDFLCYSGENFVGKVSAPGKEKALSIAMSHFNNVTEVKQYLLYKNVLFLENYICYYEVDNEKDIISTIVAKSTETALAFAKTLYGDEVKVVKGGCLDCHIVDIDYLSKQYSLEITCNVSDCKIYINNEKVSSTLLNMKPYSTYNADVTVSCRGYTTKQYHLILSETIKEKTEEKIDDITYIRDKFVDNKYILFVNLKAEDYKQITFFSNPTDCVIYSKDSNGTITTLSNAESVYYLNGTEIEYWGEKIGYREMTTHLKHTVSENAILTFSLTENNILIKATCYCGTDKVQQPVYINDKENQGYFKYNEKIKIIAGGYKGYYSIVESNEFVAKYQYTDSEIAQMNIKKLTITKETISGLEFTCLNIEMLDVEHIITYSSVDKSKITAYINSLK